MSEHLPDEKRGQSPFVRSTHRAVSANGDCPLFSSLPIAAEFWPLLDAACADELTDDQTAELQKHLESNPAAPAGLHRTHPAPNRHSPVVERRAVASLGPKPHCDQVRASN